MSLYVDNWKEEFDTKLDKLEYEIYDALYNDKDLYDKNIMIDKSTYSKIENLYKLLFSLDSKIFNNEVLSPDELKRILTNILGENAEVDEFVELYRRAYDDLWTRGMRDALRIITYNIAEALKLALAEQLGLVLNTVVMNYLQQNPGSQQFIINKLNELIGAIDDGDDVMFYKILVGLGVPSDVSRLLTVIWDNLTDLYTNYFDDTDVIEMDRWMKEEIEEVINNLNQI